MEFGINWKDIFTISMILFAVIDIVGTIPIMVDLKAKHGHIESEKASLVAGMIMIIFLFVGEELLNLIGIDVHSFAVAGSFVLFFLAEMNECKKARSVLTSTLRVWVLRVGIEMAIRFHLPKWLPHKAGNWDFSDFPGR